MDWTTPLKAQQQDFCSRLDLGNLLHCQESYLHSEMVVINEDSIEKIKVESILESEEIANKYNLTYPLKEILEIVFYRKLGMEAFLLKFGHLTWLDNHKYYEDYEASLVNSHFLVKQATNNKILIKTYSGNFKKIRYSVSAQEIEHNNLIIYTISPEKFRVNLKEYVIIFLGFIPVESLPRFNDKLDINLADFLYIGGLNFYLQNILPTDYYLLKLAKSYLKKGSYAESILLYNKSIFNNPTQSKNYFLRGISKYKLGDIQGALTDFSQTITLNDQDSLAYHWAGYLHQQLGNYPEALMEYSQEIKINPLNYFAYFNRGIIHTKLTKFIKALEDYTMAIQINHSLFQGFYNRAIIYYQLGDKDSSIEDYLKAIKIQPNLPQAYYNLGIIYQQLGEYKQAFNSYQLAIKANDKYLKSYYNLAILQADLGYYKESINTYQIISEIDPYFIPAIQNHHSLSSLLEKEGSILDDNEILSSLTQNPEVIGINSKGKNNSDLDKYCFNVPDSKQTHSF
ncbi:tetratricopeptide repeat protein [Geminocystis herdmanii]|uniref:tetratricopeptide repeat protein n=1 Tax=Geminocystis herdmanii TaxID=669359 RepID=UPI00034CC984|nr:tetratricopeptide repeat protein [Geminocystis herdmanii]